MKVNVLRGMFRLFCVFVIATVVQWGLWTLIYPGARIPFDMICIMSSCAVGLFVLGYVWNDTDQAVFKSQIDEHASEFTTDAEWKIRRMYPNGKPTKY
jgi:hypothetical protein